MEGPPKEKLEVKKKKANQGDGHEMWWAPDCQW
jgi:hypothetical protein